MKVTQGLVWGLWGMVLMAAPPVVAEEPKGATPRTSALEFKLGGYQPDIGGEAGLSFNPYTATFGNSSMLLFELELDRQLFQAFGSFGIGASVGYAEKYGDATAVGSNADVAEVTSLKVLPLRLLGVYRFDWLAFRMGIPLVPYAKAGLTYVPWWTTKGSGVEYADGFRGAGGTWGYTGVLGLALLLDTFDPRLARDFDTSVGVNHSYFFAEYTNTVVDDFGGGGFDLSDRYWMFGLALEF